MVLDLGSKLLAEGLYQRRVLPGLIAQTLNPEFSMGVAAASLPVMVLLSAGLLIGFGGWCVHLARRGRLPVWVPGLLLGGAAANLLDRIAFGAVHDWLRVPHFDLNLADLFVLAGVVGFGLALVARGDLLETKG